MEVIKPTFGSHLPRRHKNPGTEKNMNTSGTKQLSQPPKSFYRRPLPPSCLDFASDAGKQIFREALSSGGMECYFRLPSYLIHLTF